MPADQDASKATINRRRVLPRLRLYDRLDRAKDPDCRGVHREQASARGTAMRVTCDALAVEKPIWMLGDSAYDTLGWHDHLLAAGSCQSLPYNARNTDDPKTSSTGSKPASTNTARTFS